MDNTNSFSPFVQMLGVYELSPGMPVILVLYLRKDSGGDKKVAKWLDAQATSANGEPKLSRGTELQVKLLAETLSMNSKHLPEGFEPDIIPEESELKCKTSFLVPMAPLGFDAIAKLNADFGCTVCGKKSAKRCSKCQSATYCSAGMSFEINHGNLIAY